MERIGFSEEVEAERCRVMREAGNMLRTGHEHPGAYDACVEASRACSEANRLLGLANAALVDAGVAVRRARKLTP